MSHKYNLYLGKAGQQAVMSEFLVRGWNVATPEVDIGDDIFVVEDAQGIFRRVQVKASQATERANGYSVRFSIPLSQLRKPILPELYFVLAIRKATAWSDFMVIKRRDLQILHQENELGTIFGKNLMIYFSFQDKKILCSEVDMAAYRNNFDDFPIVPH